MFQNNNMAIARKIAVRSLRTDRFRSAVAVLAIAMTTLLFSSVFTMGSGLMESVQRAAMRMTGGDGHASVKYITDEEYQTIRKNPMVKEMAYCRMLCDSVDNTSLIKRQTEFWYDDDTGLRFSFTEPSGGHRPQKEEEVMADTKTLELLGVPCRVGAPVSLDLTVHGKKVRRNFVLSGWWKSDPGFNVGQIFASRAYMEARKEELKNTYWDNASLTGTITGYIKFKNSADIEGNLKKLLAQCGYSMDEKSQSYIETGINWAYLSSGIRLDPVTAAGFGAAAVLFVFAGYLIIYNIFQISVLKDIRFYGMLRTIGASGRQLRQMILIQAGYLSAVGIPAGLLAGFFVGKAFVPVMMEQSSYAGSAVQVSPHPSVFAGAAAFSVFTVWISTRKPGAVAAAVSPVEAAGYQEGMGAVTGTGKHKKTGKGNRLVRMAISNLGRNKKRTLLVIISLSLSIVLTNTVYAFSESVNVDKALEKFDASDFLIGHADLFRQHHMNGESSAVSESFIRAVSARPGFEKGGRLFCAGCSYAAENTRQTMNKNRDGSFSAAIYGLEAFPLSRLKILDGEIDLKKLGTGSYILEGVQADDHGNADKNSFNNQTGAVIELRSGDRVRKMTVLGHVVANPSTNTDGSWVGDAFFLPADAFAGLTGVRYAMSYAFDMAPAYEKGTESFLKQYTETVEPEMNYTSKFTAMSGLEGIRNTVMLIGGALALIIGLIGILNFVNVTLTSILVRRREFAMLQSIGMTKRQLRMTLCLEGGFYAGMTALLSGVLSVLCLFLIVRPFSKMIWFMSFSPDLRPLLVIIPLLLVTAVCVPLIMYGSSVKKSVSEQLKEMR